MAGKMNMCSTSETKGADNKKSDVKDKPQYAQGHKGIANSQDRILIYPAEFDAENEKEYLNFQRWCKEDGRDMPSWPPEEETPNEEEKKSQRDVETDEDSDDESDDSYDWYL